MPEVFFVDVNLREGINTSQITAARKKLVSNMSTLFLSFYSFLSCLDAICSLSKQKCSYCRSSLVASGNNGACVQCCAGKCAISFHVTCFVLAGFGLEPSDWPQPTETYCERHQRTRFKVIITYLSILHLKMQSSKIFDGQICNGYSITDPSAIKKNQIFCLLLENSLLTNRFWVIMQLGRTVAKNPK